MNELQLNITIEEGKNIFLALSEMPFKRVYDLIGRINRQTIQQNNKSKHPDNNIAFFLSGTDIDLIIESLSPYPYNQVNSIMQKLKALKHTSTVN